MVMMHRISLNSRQMPYALLLLFIYLTFECTFVTMATETIQAEKPETWIEMPFDQACALLADNSKLQRVRDADKNTPLHLTVNSLRNDLALFLIDQSIIPIDAVNCKGETALHRAILGGNLDIIRSLLQHGANPEIANTHGERPVHLAAQIGVTDLLQLLRDKKADLFSKTSSGETPLDIACRLDRLDAVVWLLSAGAKGRLPDTVKNRLAERAARNNDGDMLLTLGVKADDLAKLLDNGQTLLNIAVANGDIKLAESLLKAGVPIDLKDQFGRSPIHVAAGLSADHLSLLIEYGAKLDLIDEQGHTPLHFAANRNNTESARILVQHGIDLNARDAAGQTPVHMAAAMNSSATLQLLLDSGAALEARDPSGATALHQAARYRASAAAGVLIEAGADRLAIDDQRRTPLHLAALYDDVESARSILGSSNQAEREPGVAAIDMTDTNGETPLFLAIRAQLPFWEDISNRTPGCIDMFINCGASFDVHNATGETPLHLLVKSARIDLVSLLATTEFSVDEPDEYRNTPLHLCVDLSASQFPEFQPKASYRSWAPGQPMPPCLLADYNALVCSYKYWYKNYSKAEIVDSLKQNRARIMKFLIYHGADANRLNHKGRSPINLAYLKRDDAAIEILTSQKTR